MTKQSLHGGNVNCKIFSVEKNPEEASRSVAQNFKLLSKLTEACIGGLGSSSRLVCSICCSVCLGDLLKSFSDRRVYKQPRNEPAEWRCESEASD